MKRFFTSFLLFCCCLFAFPQLIGDLDGDGDISLYDVMSLVDIILGNTVEYDISIADMNSDGEVSLADVMEMVSIILGEKDPVELNEADTLIINYTEEGATYRMPSSWKSDITVTIEGGIVNVVNTNTTDERVTKLSGSCSNGSFTYTGAYKTTIVLSGLTLSNPSGGCIDIEDGKRVSLEIAEGTQNSLTDGAGDQKAALYCKGHLEISGGGSLNVEGMTKHAIRSKEYVELKKTAGSITITGAAGDGIHAGQYFEMKGGTISMTNIAGDGIQVEALSEGDDNDGQLFVKGGAIDITLTGNDAAGLKCDSLMTISGGTITVKSTGSDVKGLKSDSDISINGGTLNFTQSGGYLVSEETTDNGTAYEPSYTTAIRSNGDITISGGDITINNTADGGRGLNADGNIDVLGGTLNITANGAGGILDITNTGTTNNSYRLYVSIPKGGGGGYGGQSSAWTNVYLYNSNNEFIAQLTNQASFTANGKTTTFYYYDFNANTTGTFYFKSDDYTRNSTWRGGSSTYTIKTSPVNISLTGSDAFYSISSNYQTSGTTRTYSISNVTSTYANASTATEEGDTYKAFCMKADGNVNISDGSLTLSHSGIISKGVKADGTVYMNGGTLTDTASGTYMIIGTDPSYTTSIKCKDYVGNAGEITLTCTGNASRGISTDNTLTINGGTYNITLTGDGATYTGNGSTEGVGSRGLKSDGNMTLQGGDITISSSARGGKGIKVGKSSVSGTTGAKLTIGNASSATGPTLTVSTTGSYLSKSSSGGMNSSVIGSCKAVKCMGPITVNGGDIKLSTSTNSSEGLESKSTITVNGGTLESSSYDDAINAASTITFNGGNTWAHATGNDAIDSNDRSTGIVINGGVVIASSTSSPEEGFDCDNAAFKITGGTVIGTGGSQGGGGGGQGGGGLPTSASQAYATLSSVSLAANTFISLKDKSGSVVCSYKIPHNTNSATILFSSPKLSANSSATIVYGSSAVNAPSTSLWDGSYTTGATLTGGTSRTVTPVTK